MRLAGFAAACFGVSALLRQNVLSYMFLHTPFVFFDFERPLALFFADVRHNPVVDAAFKGMRPAVVALIIGPVISLARGMHWSLLAVIAASALAVWGLGWSPIYILLIAAAGGIAWELAVAPKIAKRNDKPKA